MSFVRIEQRNARLAAAVKLDQIKGREGLITKGTVVVMSNVRKGEGRDDEVTSILWTLWGKQAENAAEYLGKGSRVNVVGRLENNNYETRTDRWSTASRSPARRSTTSTARPRRRRGA
jgi:single-strand DNA-binding protein